jgi:hypothetical protein
MNMKRLLTNLGILLVLFSLAGNGPFGYNQFRGCSALGFIGQFHTDDKGMGYFHYHPVPRHGSITDCGQFIEHFEAIHQVEVSPVTLCLNSAISLIPSQEGVFYPISLSVPPLRANFSYQGISSGGIPL